MDEKTKKKILEHLSSAGLARPTVLTLMVTDGCNLQCRHCWPEARSCDVSTPVRADKLKELISEFASLDLEEICLTGGDPLTHPDWYEILRFSCELQRFKRVRLQTNGTLLTEERIRALGSIGFKGLLIQVSLDGACAPVHDRVRGAGAFDRTLRGLRRLAESGLGGRTVVAFTEMAHNFSDLPRLFRLLDDMGIGSLVSATLVRAGRAQPDAQLALPSPTHYRDMLLRFHRDTDFRERYKRMGNIACLEWLAGRSSPVGPRNCLCVERPYITADGCMYPCTMMPMERYAVHGAHHRPLEEALMEAVSLWAPLPLLYVRRSQELRACRGCPGRSHCQGGCMGRAYATTGDPMTVEDRCALRREVYSWKEPL